MDGDSTERLTLTSLLTRCSTGPLGARKSKSWMTSRISSTAWSTARARRRMWYSSRRWTRSSMDFSIVGTRWARLVLGSVWPKGFGCTRLRRSFKPPLTTSPIVSLQSTSSSASLEVRWMQFLTDWRSEFKDKLPASIWAQGKDGGCGCSACMERHEIVTKWSESFGNQTPPWLSASIEPQGSASISSVLVP